MSTTEFKASTPGTAVTRKADSGCKTQDAGEQARFEIYRGHDGFELRMQVPPDSQVAKPAKLLITLPDGRTYLAEIRTPARGFDSIQTSLPAALNHGFGHDDVLKFAAQLREKTNLSIAACFMLYEKDMLEFVMQAKARDITVLAEHDHEHKTQASRAAFCSLWEILRWIRQEFPPEYQRKPNIAKLEEELQESLSKYEALFSSAHHGSVHTHSSALNRPWMMGYKPVASAEMPAAD